MDRTLKIKDDHKRAFAVGFKFIFQNQAAMNRSDVAVAANVQPSAITYILRGYENRFPSKKAQNRIAEVFNTDMATIISIGQRIQSGQSVNFNFQQKPRHSDSEVQEFLDHFDLQEPNLSDLSAYERELLKICRSFENNEKYLQDLFDMAGDLFVSYQSTKIKKLLKKGG
jgi:transcriptional regulator with XRE-family HTH domain